MKYIVSRTSSRDDTPPCEGAQYGDFIRVDERVVDTPKKLKVIQDRENWYTQGTNHRVEHGHIMRDFSTQAWFIEINTLDDLMAFVATHGEIVLRPWPRNSNEVSIEIYDGYRE